MTNPTPTDTLDLWHRLINDPSGDAFRTVLKQLDEMRLRLESALRQPLPRKDHQSAEAALKAVKAGVETLHAAQRIWSVKHPNAPVRPTT